MGISDTFKEGFLFASKFVGAKLGSGVSERYLTTVNKAIEDGVNSILSTKSKQTDAVLGGFVAEKYHAASFNIRAAATGSTNYAVAGAPGASGALNRNAKGSVDISVFNSKGGVINDYGSKVYKNYKASIRAQAVLDENGNPLYRPQKRLITVDQLGPGRVYALERSMDPKLSLEKREAYQDVSEKICCTITDGKIESAPKTKSDFECMAKDVKGDSFDRDKHGLSLADSIHGADIMRKAVGAGLNAALITALIKAAPDLFKGVDFLIKTGKIDIGQLKATGMSALSGAADGFFRGFFACALQVMCNSGKLGKAFVNADPLFIGTTVALTLETIKNAVDVARGKQTIREMGDALIDSVAISTSYVIGSSMANVILIGAMGFAMPVIGFLIGSLIGSSLASLYNIGKNKFLSFCVDSGFTCFGLVDQDYTLPTEALKELGIDTTPIERVEVTRTEISRAEIGTTQVSRTNFETIQLVILKRGIIGVNKVGYLIK